MASHEVLRRAFKKVGCKNVASELGLSLSLIHQWSRPRDGQSGALNPLDRVAQLVALTADERLLDWLCAQRGGRFVRGRELRSLACAECERKIAELKAVMKSGAEDKQPGAGETQTGGSRCRFRLSGGRCGLVLAGRN